MDLHEPPWSSMELHGGLHGVPDNVGGPPGGLVFDAGSLPQRPLPPITFSKQMPSPFTQFQMSTQARSLPLLFRRVACSTPPTLRVLHLQHYFCLLACDFEAFPLSSLRVPRFLRLRCTNFAAAGTVAAGNYFVLLECITTSRCCCQACTVSIDEFSHHSASCRDID